MRGLVEGKPEPPRTAYADALNLFDLNAKMLEKRPNDDLLFCAMNRTWKLVYRPRRPERSELYDIVRDPRETRNIYKDASAEASGLLSFLRKSGGFVDRPFGQGQDEEALERLRSLGYVGGPARPAGAGPARH